MLFASFADFTETNQILRKVRDFTVKPEVGDTPHARLIKLLASPHTNIRELASALISALCHGNRECAMYMTRLVADLLFSSQRQELCIMQATAMRQGYWPPPG